MASDIERIYSLSPMQEGMLFHSILNRDSSAYFEQFNFSIHGALDLGLIEKTLAQLFARYDVLRTNFVYEKIQKPKQVVFKEKKPEIYYEDISGPKGADPSALIADFLRKDRERGFDLVKDPLIRVSVLKTAPEKYRLVWSFHHIIMDGWCLGIIIKDFLLIYQALKMNQPLNLKAVPPYQNFITWLEKQDYQAAARYWEKYLEDYEAQATVPKSAGAPPVGGNPPVGGKQPQGYQLEEISFVIPEKTTQTLENIAATNQVTLNTIIQGIWGILLQRYNNRNDVVFGSVVSGRPYEIAGIEEMVGLFINTIPVRIKTSAGQSFTGLVRQIQTEAFAAKKYDSHPLAEIQANSPLKQNLLDHLMVFENYPMAKAIEQSNLGSGLDFTIDQFEVFEQTHYDFGIMVMAGAALTIKFSYNRFSYHREYMKEIAGHFQTVVNVVADEPGISISEIEPLTEAQKHQILEEFNQTRALYPKNQIIHRLFEEQAAQTPGQVAVQFGERILTYGELNEKANQLAGWLQNEGVTPNSIVAILAEHSPEMAAAILGVLKAGAAYLPIDPECPGERIQYMLRDSNAGLLLTNLPRANDLGLPVKIVDLANRELYQGGSQNPAGLNQPDDLAYVIYTSGTTGVPKGVLVNHQSIANTICWRKDEYKFDNHDTVLQMFLYTFDGFLTSFFTPIVSGAKVVFIKDVKDPHAVKEAIGSGGITHFICVPSLFAAILEYLTPEEAKGLRIVTLAGEKVTSGLVKACKVMNPDIEIVNEYGPTENSVATTFYRNLQPDCDITIGKPISNTKVYIITEKEAHLQPIGIPGEICIAGTGLARGYLNRPELTAEKFVSNSFVGGPQRMYRTGDLARWNSDGNIEYLGRTDNQIKVRGYRIELGEIEKRLLEHPEIREAVVTVKDDDKGDPFLGAYYTVERELAVSEVKQHLAKSLPEYMVPSYYKQLDQMPLTPNGKLDRKALADQSKYPEPERGTMTGAEYEAPGNETEEKLAGIWREILGVKTIGIHD
ncbi:MAG TPA: amino acid adenylation domain-containing protein, partial [Bacillota bacterium]|nr:amino acid adenylation domain-containing protein [Bacillota bacterium]